jgi:hypothetical protein
MITLSIMLGIYSLYITLAYFGRCLKYGRLDKQISTILTLAQQASDQRDQAIELCERIKAERDGALVALHNVYGKAVH